MQCQKISIVHKVDRSLDTTLDLTPRVQSKDGVVWLTISDDAMLPEWPYIFPLVVVHWTKDRHLRAMLPSKSPMTRISVQDLYPEIAFSEKAHSSLTLVHIRIPEEKWRDDLPDRLSERFLCRLDWIRARAHAIQRRL